MVQGSGGMVQEGWYNYCSLVAFPFQLCPPNLGADPVGYIVGVSSAIIAENKRGHREPWRGRDERTGVWWTGVGWVGLGCRVG